MQRTLLISLPFAFAISACGGGGQAGSVVSTPSPVVTPTPTPTPTAFTGTFDDYREWITPIARSHTGEATYAHHADESVDLQTFTYKSFQVGPGTDTYSVRQVAPGVYEMDINGFGGSTFAMKDNGEPYLNGVSSYPEFGSSPEIFEIAKASGPLALDYARLGLYAWLNGSPSGANSALTFFTLGTPASSVPLTGTANYSGFVDGLWFDGSSMRRLWGSSSTMSLDFAGGSLSTTLNLAGHEDPFGDFAAAPVTTLGTFNGTGTLSGAKFSGSFSQSLGLGGGFTGQLYGVGGSEFGYNFTFLGGGTTVQGAAVGKKN